MLGDGGGFSGELLSSCHQSNAGTVYLSLFRDVSKQVDLENVLKRVNYGFGNHPKMFTSECDSEPGWCGDLSNPFFSPRCFKEDFCLSWWNFLIDCSTNPLENAESHCINCPQNHDVDFEYKLGIFSISKILCKEKNHVIHNEMWKWTEPLESQCQISKKKSGNHYKSKGKQQTQHNWRT